MALPKIDSPTFSLNVPSTGKKIRFRPFLVREEKILLMALESDEVDDVTQAVKTILRNCIVTESFDVEKSPSFDIEYIFLHIRGKSVGEVVELYLKHPDNINQAGNPCDHVQKVEIDINTVNVDFPEDHKKEILLTDTIGVVMQYPNLELQDRMKQLDNNHTENIFHIIAACMESVFDNDQVYPVAEQTQEEVFDFLESLDHEQFNKIATFFETMPVLRHRVEYTCEGCGEDQVYTVEGIENFF